MFSLELVKEITRGKILDADLSPGGKLGIIACDDETCSLLVGEESWFSWEQNENPHIRHARWISDHTVAIWSLPTRVDMTDAVLTCSKSERKVLAVGGPKDLIFGQNTYFVCFGEDQFLRASDTDLESNMIAAFSSSNDFLFGTREIVTNTDDTESPTEAQIGCITRNDEGVFALSGCNVLWRVNPARRLVTKITFPEKPHRLAALSEFNGNILFVAAEASGFRLGRINLSYEKIEFVGEIAYSKLNIHNPFYSYDPSYVRLHGCSDGRFVLSTQTNVWSLRYVEK